MTLKFSGGPWGSTPIVGQAKERWGALAMEKSCGPSENAVLFPIQYVAAEANACPPPTSPTSLCRLDHSSPLFSSILDDAAAKCGMTSIVHGVSTRYISYLYEARARRIEKITSAPLTSCHVRRYH